MSDDSTTGSFDPENSGADPGPTDGLPTNERDYIIPAQDAKGHHIRLYCRAMPAIGRMVSDVHQSRKYPFRTVGDLVRWCVTVGVKQLASGAGINSVMAHADAMMATFQDEEFQLQFLEFFNHLQRVTNSYVECGASGEARRVAAQTRATIERMPEGYFKDRYREELLRRYSVLLDAREIPAGALDVSDEQALLDAATADATL